MEDILKRLRETKLENHITSTNCDYQSEAAEELIKSGVKFVSSTEGLENSYYKALNELIAAVRVPKGMDKPVLYEGSLYIGSWLESIINLEKISRFLPSIARNNFEAFADFQREDGLLPYSIKDTEGAQYSHIQIVTPLARCIWFHYIENGRDKVFLKKMYHAMEQYDQWIETYRNTRGTGCVEAFCIWDTGHDNSCRFWHIPDAPPEMNPKLYDKNSPFLPYLAPDLSANIYAQRKYLAVIAEELGFPSAVWTEKAEKSLNALNRYCYDGKDDFYYDLDRSGNFVRVQSDVLLRVLACEVGDETDFQRMLKKYLLNTKKFFARFPLTSVALDDPRFERDSTHNTWSGPTNALTLLRTPYPFEYHGHFVELTWIMQPMVFNLGKKGIFGQCMDPWSGNIVTPGGYCPSILTFLDYLERLCGILPTGENEVWFSGTVPKPYRHGEPFGDRIGYSRILEGNTFEMVADRLTMIIYMNGEKIVEAPSGIRVVMDRKGNLKSLIGLTLNPVSGEILYKGEKLELSIHGNEILRFANSELVCYGKKEIVFPVT